MLYDKVFKVKKSFVEYFFAELMSIVENKKLTHFLNI